MTPAAWEYNETSCHSLKLTDKLTTWHRMISYIQIVFRMSLPLNTLVLLALLGFLCAAQPLDKRMSIPSINRLKLYAYGANIGGLPVFSADGKRLDGKLATLEEH